MRILQINTVYKVGSTGKIVYEIHKQLQQSGYESYVIYGRGSLFKETSVFKTSPDWDGKLQAFYGRFSGNFYGGALFSTYNLKKRIEKISPEIVHIHLLNGNYVNNCFLLNFLAENNYKIIITLHAEIMYTGLCEHALDCEKWKSGCGNCPQNFTKYHSWFFDRTSFEWQKKLKIFSKFNNLTLVSVSTWLQERAMQSPMFINRNFIVIGNGIDTDIFKPVDSTILKKRLGVTNEKVILHVTPSFKYAIKGGEYVIQIARRLINQNVKIIIVGFDGYDGQLPTNIITIKHTESQQELAEYYSMAYITLLTSKMETFSLVSAESLSCGTPVVGFKAGGPEQISIPEFSEFVENGNIESLEKVVRKWLDMEHNSKKIIEAIDNKYSKLKMSNEYIHVYENI